MAKVPSRSYRIRLLLVYPILSAYVLVASVIGSVLFCILLTGSVTTIQLVIDTGLRLSVFTHFFVFPLTAAIVYCYKVAVSPDYIWCLDLWGNLVSVTWGSIRSVRKSIIPGLPAYILVSDEQKRILFVPRFLVGWHEFVEKVEEYGGSDNPLYLAIWRSVEPQEN